MDQLFYLFSVVWLFFLVWLQIVCCVLVMLVLVFLVYSFSVVCCMVWLQEKFSGYGRLFIWFIVFRCVVDCLLFWLLDRNIMFGRIVGMVFLRYIMVDLVIFLMLVCLLQFLFEMIIDVFRMVFFSSMFCWYSVLNSECSVVLVILQQVLMLWLLFMIIFGFIIGIRLYFWYRVV